MIQVNVVKAANYPVGVPVIKRRLKDFLLKAGIVSDCEVAVALVGEKKALETAKTFLKDNKTHNVLSFTQEELKGEKFVYPPDGKIYLGEIVICYPLVLKEAKAEGKLINDKVMELVEHGAEHLLGRHHE